jgi:hypothetical protein
MLAADAGPLNRTHLCFWELEESGYRVHTGACLGG